MLLIYWHFLHNDAVQKVKEKETHCTCSRIQSMGSCQKSEMTLNITICTVDRGTEEVPLCFSEVFSIKCATHFKTDYFLYHLNRYWLCSKYNFHINIYHIQHCRLELNVPQQSVFGLDSVLELLKTTKLKMWIKKGWLTAECHMKCNFTNIFESLIAIKQTTKQ